LHPRRKKRGRTRPPHTAKEGKKGKTKDCRSFPGLQFTFLSPFSFRREKRKKKKRGEAEATGATTSGVVHYPKKKKRGKRGGRKGPCTFETIAARVISSYLFNFVLFIGKGKEKGRREQPSALVDSLSSRILLAGLFSTKRKKKGREGGGEKEKRGRL